MKRDGKIKENYMLGRFLKRDHPDVAQFILETYVYPLPLVEDLTMIGPLREKFRGLGLEAKWNMNQLFISCVIRLCNPQLYRHPAKALIVRSKLVKEVAAVLSIDVGAVSRYIRSAIFYEKTYEDYRILVDDIVQKIQNNQ
jgi:hypothetical protein